MEHHSRNTFMCPLFQLLYAGIVRDGGEVPADFGSSNHQREVYAGLVARRCFARKGVYVRLRRWNSWHDRVKELSVDWHAWLYAIAVIGISRGWWTCLEDTGLAKLEKRVEEPDTIDPEAPADIVGHEKRRSREPSRSPATRSSWSATGASTRCTTPQGSSRI